MQRFQKILALSVSFLLMNLSMAESRCIPITPSNTGTITIAVDYANTKNELRGVRLDREHHKKHQDYFSNNHLNLCAENVVTCTKEHIISTINTFVADKSFINFIFSGHGILTPVFDVKGNFLRIEWALVLPSYASSECAMINAPSSDWGTYGLSGEIIRNNAFKESMLEYAKLCEKHLLKMSDLPFRADMTVTGIIDTCHASGAKCSLNNSQTIFMSSADKKTSIDSLYNHLNDPEFKSLLKKEGVSDPDPLLTFGQLMEKAQREHGYSFPTEDKAFSFPTWLKGLMEPFGYALFKTAIENRSKKTPEEIKQFMDSVDKSLVDVKKFNELERNRRKTHSTPASFFHALADRDYESLDSDSNGKISIAEYYFMSKDLSDRKDKPELHKGTNCSQVWLEKTLFELNKYKVPSKTNSHTSSK